MSNHTPGPWIWSPDYRGLFGAGECNAVFDYAYTENMWLGQENQEANALLIAAAPDLLAALQECLQNTGGGWIAASVVERAQAIVARATGGAA